MQHMGMKSCYTYEVYTGQACNAAGRAPANDSVTHIQYTVYEGRACNVADCVPAGESRYTCGWVVSRIWDESCHTFEWEMVCIWKLRGSGNGRESERERERERERGETEREKGVKREREREQERERGRREREREKGARSERQRKRNECLCVCVWKVFLWHDLFVQVTWLVRRCDMNHSNVWHDSHVTWLIRMSDTTHVWHDIFVCVIWQVTCVPEDTCRQLLTPSSRSTFIWLTTRMCRTPFSRAYGLRHAFFLSLSCHTYDTYFFSLSHVTHIKIRVVSHMSERRGYDTYVS